MLTDDDDVDDVDDDDDNDEVLERRIKSCKSHTCGEKLPFHLINQTISQK
jgi:hypothetical protein